MKINLPLARLYLEMAIAQREAAKALAYSNPVAAANCRVQMRIHAKRAADHLSVPKYPMPAAPVAAGQLIG